MSQADAYKQAGVDIDAGNALVERIKPLAAATKRPGVSQDLGGFGALFDLKAAGYEDPVLVAGTDGVGTKLKVAIDSGIHHTAGIDLVAMCVNDLVVQGAEPLFFLDYMATGKLSVEAMAAVVEGIAEGCKQAGCALIGGETAEMPGMYQAGDYDLAGFAVGAVEREHILPKQGAMQAGDVVLGLASSGVHSNGFSLVRKIIADQKLRWQDAAPFAQGRTMAEAFLEPTKVYVRSCLAAVRTGKVSALAHITGGGLTENIPRVLPESLAVRINPAAMPELPVFRWLQQAGGITDADMLRTFNCGVGMVVICSAEGAPAVQETLEAQGEAVCVLGEVTDRKEQAVVFEKVSS